MSDEIATRVHGAAMRGEMLCHACGGPSEATRPYVWKVGAIEGRGPWLSIWLTQRCCGAIAHTEQVALTCTYLHDGKRNAELICKLMNEHNDPERSKHSIDIEAVAKRIRKRLTKKGPAVMMPRRIYPPPWEDIDKVIADELSSAIGQSEETKTE